jgi:hypothetical protein
LYGGPSPGERAAFLSAGGFQNRFGAVSAGVHSDSAAQARARPAKEGGVIKVFMRRETKDFLPAVYFYKEGVSCYGHDGWLFVIDDEGNILGSHPEQNINAVDWGKAGEATLKRENTD